MRALLRIVALLSLVLSAQPALAQVVDPELFGDGKPPAFKSEDVDRRFLKTGIYGALNELPKDPSCRKIVATLLTAYAQSLLYLHRKDQNFYCDPVLLQTLTRTSSSQEFPAPAYLAAMIRKTMIDKKVPASWIANAEKLRTELQAPIATSRMQVDAQELHLIDSFSFNMPALLDRYAREVKLAPSVAVDAAEDKFRDKYMDRDVTWGGLILHDVAKQAPPEPPKKKGKKSKKSEPPPPTEEEQPTWAVVGFPVGPAPSGIPGLSPSGPVPQIEIRARLADNQPVDLTKFIRGQRVLVKGRLWSMGPNMAWLEIRDAFLFPDPDWNTWPGVATQADVQECPIAVNDLSPYGYKSKDRSGAAPNPFVHTKE